MSLRPWTQSPGEQVGVPKSQMFSPTFLTFIWPLNTFLNYTNKYLLSFFLLSILIYLIASIRASVLQNIFGKQELDDLSSLFWLRRSVTCRMDRSCR